MIWGWRLRVMFVRTLDTGCQGFMLPMIRFKRLVSETNAAFSWIAMNIDFSGENE